ncbi:MAG: LacI family transcriptional regulator [Planctomycetes bacterium]|nr:LacI family transcriptional regulator [Planctomycetota bacterium]
MDRDGGARQLRLQDIARKAGVSAATVSLVINNKGAISDKTRDRVKKILADSGYIYDKRAAAMRTRRSYEGGVLMQDITNPYFAEMLSGLSEHFSRSNYLYFLGTAAEKNELQHRPIEAFMETGMDGAILYLARNTPSGLRDEIKRWGRPVVLVFRRFGRDDFDFLGTDHYWGGKIATEALIRAGHKRIIFAGGSALSPNRKDRYRGYADALEEAGLRPAPGDSYLSESYTRRDGFELAEQILKRGKRADAVMFFTDALALGAISAFERAGVEPGRDIGVIGFDDIKDAAMSIPALCTVSADPAGIGQRMASMLLARIKNPSRPVVRIHEKPALVIRETSGCRGR